jgi:DNA-binding CsgD family transcriptional regulator
MKDVGEQVLELHGLGMRSIDIAHRLEVAQSTVHYHLRKAAEVAAKPAAQSTGPRRSHGETRRLVAGMLAQGLSRAEIARRLGVRKSTVTYHAARLGEEVDVRCGRRFDWSRIQAFYDEGNSVRECMRVFGFSSWAWTGAVRRGHVTPRPGFKPLDQVFVAGSRRNRGHLKRRLLRAGIKEERCERCGLSEWRGQLLSLSLHHINGDRYDNRIENLELLCPNCHSQTDTYSGRNGRAGITAREYKQLSSQEEKALTKLALVRPGASSDARRAA